VLPTSIKKFYAEKLKIWELAKKFGLPLITTSVEAEVIVFSKICYVKQHHISEA
jgi:hypothetical protein